MTPDLTTLAWLQAWSGAPLYLVASVLQGLWLHRRGYALTGIVATALLTSALTVLAGLVIWGRYLAGIDIMLWDAVNLPALIATIIVFPVVTALIAFGFANPGRG